MKVLGIRHHPHASELAATHHQSVASLYVDLMSYGQIDTIEICPQLATMVIAGYDINSFDRILFSGFPSVPSYFCADQSDLLFLQQEWDAVITFVLFSLRAKVINFELVRPDRAIH